MPRNTWNSKLAHATSQQRLLDTIGAALDGLRYGTVEIIVHDGHVVQIERREKLRFDGALPSKSFKAVKT